MATTRREQPVLQEALRWAEGEGVKFARLPRTFNCRGATSCGPVKLKNGDEAECLLIHGHGVAAGGGVV